MVFFLFYVNRFCTEKSVQNTHFSKRRLGYKKETPRAHWRVNKSDPSFISQCHHGEFFSNSLLYRRTLFISGRKRGSKVARARVCLREKSTKARKGSRRRNCRHREGGGRGGKDIIAYCVQFTNGSQAWDYRLAFTHSCGNGYTIINPVRYCCSWWWIAGLPREWFIAIDAFDVIYRD